MENYLSDPAREWEVMPWLKARQVAGDFKTGATTHGDC